MDLFKIIAEILVLILKACYTFLNDDTDFNNLVVQKAVLKILFEDLQKHC